MRVAWVHLKQSFQFRRMLQRQRFYTTYRKSKLIVWELFEIFHIFPKKYQTFFKKFFKIIFIWSHFWRGFQKSKFHSCTINIRKVISKQLTADMHEKRYLFLMRVHKAHLQFRVMLERAGFYTTYLESKWIAWKLFEIWPFFHVKAKKGRQLFSKKAYKIIFI